MRTQYHFRQSDRGLLAWDVRRLVELSKALPVRQVRLTEIRELDECHWYSAGGSEATCRSVVHHCALIDQADLSFAVILAADGRVMDGMHRVCKALLKGHECVSAVQFERTPEPDFVGRTPESLPYES